MEEEITEIIEPIRFAQFAFLEAYNAVNVAIVQYKDQLTGGEYSRTNTKYEYNPTPEAHADGFFYMPTEPAHNWAFKPNSGQGWTAGDKTINLKGVNAARTSASNAAVATLVSKSVSVLTN